MLFWLNRFNCAAPFRERLYDVRGAMSSVQGASIVPPPFGSGYQRDIGEQQRAQIGFNCAAGTAI